MTQTRETDGSCALNVVILCLDSRGGSANSSRQSPARSDVARSESLRSGIALLRSLSAVPLPRGLLWRRDAPLSSRGDRRLYDPDYCIRLQLSGAELHLATAVVHFRYRSTLYASTVKPAATLSTMRCSEAVRGGDEDPGPVYTASQGLETDPLFPRPCSPKSGRVRMASRLAGRPGSGSVKCPVPAPC
jgi:hypothetical protein